MSISCQYISNASAVKTSNCHNSHLALDKCHTLLLTSCLHAFDAQILEQSGYGFVVGFLPTDQNMRHLVSSPVCMFRPLSFPSDRCGMQQVTCTAFLTSGDGCKIYLRRLRTSSGSYFQAVRVGRTLARSRANWTREITVANARVIPARHEPNPFSLCAGRVESTQHPRGVRAPGVFVWTIVDGVGGRITLGANCRRESNVDGIGNPSSAVNSSQIFTKCPAKWSVRAKRVVENHWRRQRRSSAEQTAQEYCSSQHRAEY